MYLANVYCTDFLSFYPGFPSIVIWINSNLSRKTIVNVFHFKVDFYLKWYDSSHEISMHTHIIFSRGVIWSQHRMRKDELCPYVLWLKKKKKLTVDFGSVVGTRKFLKYSQKCTIMRIIKARHFSPENLWMCWCHGHSLNLALYNLCTYGWSYKPYGYRVN